MARIYKAGEQSDADPLEFVMSDETVDRVGDVIEAAGWDLREFRKNPVALFGHDSGAPPVGRWENVRIEGRRLVGRLKLAAAGTSPLIDTLRALVEQRILKAVSVGFQPLKAVPIEADRPYGPQRFTRQTLLECSLVSVPANPNALSLAKHLSPNDRRRLFGESARLSGGGDLDAGPAQAGVRHSSPSNPRKGATMSSLNDRISTAQERLTALRDQHAPLTRRIADGETLAGSDAEAFDDLAGEIEATERDLTRMRATERSLAGRAQAVERSPRSPAIVQAGHLADRGRPMDLLIQAHVCALLGHIRRQPIEMVRAERYRDRDDLAAVVKAVTNPAMTDVVGWAAELVDTAIADFIEALSPDSVYARLSPKGARFTFGRSGAIKIPRRDRPVRQPGDLRGSFVGEGQPIPVRRGSLGSVTLNPFKMGVISTYSREIAMHSTPAIEALIRDGILEDNAIAIDETLLDSNAMIAGVRPAGLLNGVTPTAGAAGADVAAVIADLTALTAPFVAANAATGIVLLANPSDLLRLGLLTNALGDFVFRDEIGRGTLLGFSLISSSNVPARTLIAVRGPDFASATGDTPAFDISDTATIHEEDGGYPASNAQPDPAVPPGPLPIVSGPSATPVVATPVRSLWQTATIGVRMLLDISWAMRRAGMVSAVEDVTW